jgi:hypothetical protein
MDSPGSVRGFHGSKNERMMGFVDFGWTHLNQKDVAQAGTGARLIDAANGILRASLGGEL